MKRCPLFVWGRRFSFCFHVAAFLADDLFIHLEIVGQKKRKRAININGSAIGGLKKIRGFP
jgi:hypothetical protein